MASAPALIDTSTLSEVMRGRNPAVLERATEYLSSHGPFRFSIITRYEILRGLFARDAQRQAARFEERCRSSTVVPLTDVVVVDAASLYGLLYRRGELISDADLLIAATARCHGLVLITENAQHFRRLPGLTVDSWRPS